MGAPYGHIRHQGPVIAGLGRVAWAAAAQKLGIGPPPLRELPGPEATAVLPPRDRQMVRDYVRWAGGDPAMWKRNVPHHLFPQWCFPLQGRTLEGISYPIAKVLNGGCRLDLKAPIPMDSPLHVSAQLTDIDDNGKRAILTQRLTTALPDGTVALEAQMYAFIPLGGGKGDKSDTSGKSKRPRKARPLVHPDARPLGTRRLTPDDGMAFACLTGDFNPIHWLKPYAVAAGFGRTILHGFGTMALAIERLRRGLWAGDIHWPQSFEVRFTRPLKLPAKVGVFVHGTDFFVGPAPGAPAYLTGSFTPLTAEPPHE